MDDIALKPRSFAPERDAGRRANRGAAMRALRRWPPLHAWRARRRITVAGVVALAAWLFATATSTMADGDGRRAAEAALTDAQHRLADARRQIAALPASRQAALAGQSGSSAGSSSANLASSGSSADPASSTGWPEPPTSQPTRSFPNQLPVPQNPQNASMTMPTTAPHPPPGQRASPLPRASTGPRGVDYSAADVRRLSQLAAATGVVLMSLEPGAESRGDAQTTRLVKLAAQTDFAHLNEFLRQLQTLPALAVPAEITVKRHGDGLSVTAMLRIFDGLHAPSSSPASDAMQARQIQPKRRTQQQADAGSPEDSFPRIGAQSTQQMQQTPQTQLQLQQIQQASQIQPAPQTQARQTQRTRQTPQQTPPSQQARQTHQTRQTHDHKPMLFDPFGPPSGDAPDSGTLRLTGVIADRANAVALVETPQGTQTVSRGSSLGSERVIQIGIPEIVLSHGDATRTLTWEEKADAQ